MDHFHAEFITARCNHSLYTSNLHSNFPFVYFFSLVDEAFYFLVVLSWVKLFICHSSNADINFLICWQYLFVLFFTEYNKCNKWGDNIIKGGDLKQCLPIFIWTILKVLQDMGRVIVHFWSMWKVNKLRESTLLSLIELKDRIRNRRASD